MTTVCVDTNIWVYALTRPTSGDPTRHKRAQQAIQATESVLITPQIINELGFVLRRKQGWQDAELRPLIEQLQSDCRLHIPSAQWHLLALDLRNAHRLAYWDSLIVAAAIEAGCDTLLSEDMHDGHVLPGLRIVNPLV